jgi:hypothetical protein
MRSCRLLLFVTPQYALAGPVLLRDVSQNNVNRAGRAVEGFTRNAGNGFNKLLFLLVGTTGKQLNINRRHGFFPFR